LVEIALLALLSVLAGVALALYHGRRPGALGLWLVATAAVFGTGVCQLLVEEVRWILLPGYALAVLYPALLLAGALVYAGRGLPAWLLPLALGAGVARAVSAELGWSGLALGVGLATQPTAALLAAALVLRAPQPVRPSPAHRALGPALLGVAVLEALTLGLTPVGEPIRLTLLCAWIPAVPLLLALQVVAASDRSHDALRQARDQLEQRVAERTAELASSLAALRASEERYRTVSGLSSDYSFSIRVAPDLSVEFEWVTDALTEISGYRAEEVRGAGWLSRVPEADREQVREQLHEVLAGARKEMEVRIRTRAGELRTVALRFGTRRDEADGVVHIVGAGRDVTELKRGEAERRRLDSVVRDRQHVESLGLLAGGIAHDFNNVLTVILGNTALALADLEPDSPVRERLARIEAVARHASELTDQMLTYAGRASVALRPLDLSVVVRDALDLLRASVAEKIHLDVELARELPAMHGDPLQLRQVLLNLVGNASEASAPDGGRVAIRTGGQVLGAAELVDALPGSDAAAGEYVYLEVADQGIGIAPELRARIFEPFFTTRASGRGLGLAAVFGIVSAHSGVIRVISTPGAGTSFRVLFPAA
jgi:PAS domain S-box-containing protein